ncbi:MAG: glycosyltransferase [Desulfobacterales bacterium]
MKILFLSWECPWPAHGGGALRTFGLLKQLSEVYEIELIVLSENDLSDSQKAELQKYVSSLIRVPVQSVTQRDRIRIFAHMFRYRMPYHCALLDVSFQRAPEVLKHVYNFPSVIYASFGHWGTLVKGHKASNWILDQHNADVDFWRAYAANASNFRLKWAAMVNWRLAAAHFPGIYSSVGRVISVCEEDRQLTLSIEPHAQVEVIENGVDCAYYAPERSPRTGPPRILFTGTSAPRNVTALRRFMHNVWPLIQREQPQAELLVAGNFQPEAQIGFKKYDNMHFTGRVEDMRPYFNQSDVYIAPFEETHGSKLKIAEAMAMGMAIVSTPQGIRGFSLIDGKSVSIAHSYEEFGNHVIRLLNNFELREQQGKAARKAALSTIDWGVLGKRLRGIIEETQEAVS